MNETYRYRDSYWGPRTVDPATIAQEFARLEKNGRLTAEHVLEEARPEEAPLHDNFPWDDAAAAHEHRLTIARQLIRSVVVVYQAGERAGYSAPVYIHVPIRAGNEGYYMQATVLASRPDELKRALGEAERDLKAAENRCSEIWRLAPERQDAQTQVIQGFTKVREGLAQLTA